MTKACQTAMDRCEKEEESLNFHRKNSVIIRQIKEIAKNKHKEYNPIFDSQQA